MIAKEAGIPKSNVVYYFKSKAELYRVVVDEIFNLWLGAADPLETETSAKTALKLYIEEKMDLARSHPYGSKVWANEIIHGAPFIQEYIEGELRDWMKSREAIVRKWIKDGQMNDITPRTLFYMIWACTQHYADFSHQIETLNGNKKMSASQWQKAKTEVTEVILGGLGIQ